MLYPDGTKVRVGDRIIRVCAGGSTSRDGDHYYTLEEGLGGQVVEIDTGIVYIKYNGIDHLLGIEHSYFPRIRRVKYDFWVESLIEEIKQ